MIQEVALSLLKEMEKKLQAAGKEDVSPLEKLKATLTAVNAALEEVRKRLLAGSFADEAEEINFFKRIKPAFLARRITAIEIYTIESGKPQGNPAALKGYLEEELSLVQRFFHKHRFLYQYYRMDASELDALFFLRSGDGSPMLLAEWTERDREFSSPGDALFARFIAFEELQRYLLFEMSMPAGDVDRKMLNISKKGRELRWTGDSCNLVEIAYGIYDTRQLNNGEADLSDIMDVLEQCFGVNLSRYFRRFTEIKRRKTISKTRFLDQMREAVNKRIDEGDEFKPPKKPDFYWRKNT
ncbi:hypothetical protein GS399_05220 [Pedobacter sp. HMF7647]|uniref:Tetracycline regulation of excision, RteC n=1 Tax=Hufsiella arboris TaxID=2695275 RepID=A0A7K1Y721_9SPHI|nr:RteC domain-containing protein [Hufsiella arboris]MXV50365.1 hypothetical protein [Hufsiella arboris]